MLPNPHSSTSHIVPLMNPSDPLEHDPMNTQRRQFFILIQKYPSMHTNFIPYPNPASVLIQIHPRNPVRSYGVPRKLWGRSPSRWQTGCVTQMYDPLVYAVKSWRLALWFTMYARKRCTWRSRSRKRPVIGRHVSFLWLDFRSPILSNIRLLGMQQFFQRITSTFKLTLNTKCSN